jgi:serine/threonine-protein kinase
VRRSDGQLSIKVLDFGISKVTEAGDGADAVAMTKTSALMGSPLYMSPEQMRSSKDVDARTDIWALGMILFELCTGRTAFVGESVAHVAIRIATEATPSMRAFRPEVPAALEAAVFQCLEKERTARYRNVGELAVALLPFAPRRAKGSVERISGIIQSAGLSASALAVPASPADLQSHPTGTLPAVGRTTTGAPARRSPASVVAVVLGILLSLGGVAAVVTRARLHGTETAPVGPSSGPAPSAPPIDPAAQLPSVPPDLAALTPSSSDTPPASRVESATIESQARHAAVSASPAPAASRPSSGAKTGPTDRAHPPASAGAPAAASTTSAAPTPPPPANPSCNPPYFINPAGHREYKRECL